VPVSTSASWSWDGRDFSGRVVEPGVYTLVAEAEGSRGERGVACSRSVILTQRGAP
jgi:flagellar hook assembly protein FlgD